MKKVILLAVGLSCGCATTNETTDGQAPMSSSSGGDPTYVDLALESPAPGVATIQLYRHPDERTIPMIVIGSDQVLNLEFDLLGDQGKALRIEFKHVTRRWEDDQLHPGEYLAGRVDDEILNYRRSLASRSQYIHYRYSFPNETIRFTRSGNYVLTVSERSGDGGVLFQQPFLISEESSGVGYEVRAVGIPGSGGLWSQPVVIIDPGAEPQRDLFDWGACFVKNTRFDLARCSARPSLFEAPYASFSLEPENSFEPEPDLHVVDLGELRRGLWIDEVRYEATPYEVVLIPDQADLSGPEISFQNGQSSVSASVVEVGNPDVEAEYVHATFRYIPYRSRRAAGEVIVTGSFNRWVLDAANSLVWNEADGLYEGTVLLKQGVHAYQYYISGPRPPSQGVFAPESSYTALLYYFDPISHVDRLIAVRSKIAP